MAVPSRTRTAASLAVSLAVVAAAAAPTAGARIPEADWGAAPRPAYRVVATAPDVVERAVRQRSHRFAATGRRAGEMPASGCLERAVLRGGWS